MSFILEALKKSEKNRQETTTPTLETQHDQSSPAPRKRPLWPMLLLVVLLLNAAVLLWLFGPWHDTDAVTEVAPAATRVEPTPPQTATVAPVAPTTPPAPAPMTPPTPEPVVAAPAVMPEPQVVATLPPAVAPADAAVAQTIVNTQAVATVQQPTPAAVPATETVAAPEQTAAPQVVSNTATPPPAPQPPARNVLALTELPGSIQQQLPRLHLSVHAYTGDQNTSLIRLNDRIMRAGSYLEDRYRLEEITSDGAIFSYQGYYFLVPRRGA
jgi:general secretion pathway protein B